MPLCASATRGAEDTLAVDEVVAPGTGLDDTLASDASARRSRRGEGAYVALRTAIVDVGLVVCGDASVVRERVPGSARRHLALPARADLGRGVRNTALLPAASAILIVVRDRAAEVEDKVEIESVGARGLAAPVPAGAGAAVEIRRRADVAHRPTVLRVRVGIDRLAKSFREEAEEPARRHFRVPGVAAADVAGASVTSSDAVLDRRANIAERTAAEGEPSQYLARGA